MVECARIGMPHRGCRYVLISAREYALLLYAQSRGSAKNCRPEYSKFPSGKEQFPAVFLWSALQKEENRRISPAVFRIQSSFRRAVPLRRSLRLHLLAEKVLNQNQHNQAGQAHQVCEQAAVDQQERAAKSQHTQKDVYLGK